MYLPTRAFKTKNSNFKANRQCNSRSYALRIRFFETFGPSSIQKAFSAPQYCSQLITKGGQNKDFHWKSWIPTASLHRNHLIFEASYNNNHL